MEYKARLKKPCTNKEYMNFIVEYNHKKNYEIKETDKEYLAIGLTKEELTQKEREDIDRLSLTKREVFLALKKAKNIMPEDIRKEIKEEESLIEFDYATLYLRGNPLINKIGQKLGITSEQLDNFFKTNNWEELIK